MIRLLPSCRAGFTVRRGVVLVATLWILAALIATVLTLSLTVRTEMRITAGFAESARAEAAAEAGIERAMVELEHSSPEYTRLDQAKSEIHSKRELDGIRSGQYLVQVSDESGKLDLKAIAGEQGGTDFCADVLSRLLRPDLAQAIGDWCDEDEDPRPFGAETDYYRRLHPPYTSRNAPPSSLDELLLAKGVTAQLLIGASGRRGVPASSSTGLFRRGDIPLQEIITVHSREDNTDGHCRPRLNLLIADRDQFQKRLGDMLSDGEIEAILKFRDGNTVPQTTDPQAAEAQGVQTARTPLKKLGDLLRVPMLRDRVQAIADRLTLSGERTLAGRININTAPPELLRALPGMTDNVVGDIVAFRNGAGGPFRSVGDLLALPSVSNQLFTQLADRLTVRSNAFRVISEGWAPGSPVRRRVAAVIVLVTQKTASAPDAPLTRRRSHLVYRRPI